MCLFQTNDSFSVVYSAGRDKRVWATDLRNTDYRCCVCEEKEPILKVGLLSLVVCLVNIKSMN